MKKLLSFLLALCLVIGLVPLTAWAEEVASGTCGDDLTWKIADGVLTISGTGSMNDYDGSEAKSPWKEYADSFDKVVISEGVTSIGNYAFFGSAMQKIYYFPSTLESVGYAAFEWAAVPEVHIPTLEDWLEIEFDSFYANPFLESTDPLLYIAGEPVTNIVIPESTTGIGVAQFAGYSSMTSISIPNTVTRVEEYAFGLASNGSASKLTSITFPSSVEYIGEVALGYQTKLEKIYILNPSCDIAYEHSEEVDGSTYYYEDMYHGVYYNTPTIYGYAGSTAEAYAELHEFTFVALSEEPEPTEPTPTEPDPTEPSEPDPTPVTNPFTDVKTSDYFYQPVLWAVGKGVTTGVSATQFAPNQTCTRAQVVTFLWRAAGEPEPTSTRTPFTDVKSSEYYYKAVLWAVEEGITTGISSTQFGPSNPCTRGQVVTFLWRAAGEPEPASSRNPFADVKSSEYFYKAVLWAVEAGVTTGLSATQFGPTDSCTRGQIVTFLYRADV